ncbi:MAG: hypothetical protein OXD32_00045, partial [Endozoicomonadaceae bacterium]|nr:hypothetical protein [Endozoicomonadaceae bacterium]
ATIAAGIGAAAGLIGAAEAGGAAGAAGGAVVANPEILAAATLDASQVIADSLPDIPAMDELSEAMNSAEELENSVDEDAVEDVMLASTSGNESVTDDEDPLGTTLVRINCENISGERRAVFGCGRGPDILCDHGGVTTYSEEEGQLPDYHVVLDQPTRNVITIVGRNRYDKILQESTKGNWLKVAHAALKPGGKFYVLAPGSENDAEEWLDNYMEQGEGMFRNVNYIRFNPGQSFGVRSNEDEFQWGAIFIK